MAKKPAEHTVRDADDVDRLLDRYGIDSVNDIRRAHGSRRHHIDRTDDAERLDLSATGSPDRVATDTTALGEARNQLIAQYVQVDQLIDSARGLGVRMKDGHGPIAAAIRARFKVSADDEQGVLRALTNYRDELGQVIQAIDQTLGSYDRTELDAVQRLTASGGANG